MGLCHWEGSAVNTTAATNSVHRAPLQHQPNEMDLLHLPHLPAPYENGPKLIPLPFVLVIARGTAQTGIHTSQNNPFPVPPKVR